MTQPTESSLPKADEAPAKETLKDKFSRLTALYGPVLLIIHFSLFGLVLAGSFIAIKTGFKTDGAAEQAGTLAGAYALTQLTKPVRIAATLALTPLVGALVNRLRGRGDDEQP